MAKQERYWCNNQIRARSVRVLDSNGNQVGVLPVKEALSLAKDAGLDLIEIAPKATPPVCKIANYGKFMYEISKHKKEHAQHATKCKEIQFRTNIAEHDFQTKFNHLNEFLNKGYPVKLTLKFKGREMAHRDLGFEVLARVKEQLNGSGHMTDPKLTGRNITSLVSPQH